MPPRAPLPLVALLLALTGCAAMSANARARDEAKVRDRATFDLHCPRPDIELTGPQKIPNIGGDIFSSYGARGCGQQPTYVQAPDGSWIMNSAATS